MSKGFADIQLNNINLLSMLEKIAQLSINLDEEPSYEDVMKYVMEVSDVIPTEIWEMMTDA
jgi:hypothetical protein